MAITIKTVPTLDGKVAKSFKKTAKAALLNKGTIDFSEQVRSAKAILEKAQLS